MKHFGDITKIHGWEVPIVDVVTGGSPCQDLSVAGKREGLAGERSGLFMEQIRIVKEMREYDIKTNGHMGVYVRPRYLVWENVTGAFSSNGGEDFRIVLEEICKVADKDTVIPGPSGKWQPAGCIVGNGWSVAWRTHDAQYWGVPQRRKRICVLADFGGATAGEILFELQRETADGEEDKIVGYSRRGGKPEVQSVCESLRGDTAESEEQGEAVAGDIRENVEGSISSQDDMLIAYSKVIGVDNYNQTMTGDVAHPIRSKVANADHIPCVLCQSSFGQYREGFGTLKAKGGDAGGGSETLIVQTENPMVTRKLTPLECERLQGFPDGWTDIGDWVDSKGKKHKGESDSPRYKALGNSIALPFWEWMAERMVAQLRKDGSENPTMASLFDGIGGFPLVYQRNGCEPVWASEIEEFPMAVTKIRFPEGE